MNALPDGGMTIRLSPENTANLQRLVALVELDPETILNGYLLNELNYIDEESFGVARGCALCLRYSDRQTALRVAARLSRRAWAAGMTGMAPLMVAQKGNQFVIYEREAERIPTG